jgi:cytolysin-activating lysine-acyltransferase
VFKEYMMKKTESPSVKNARTKKAPKQDGPTMSHLLGEMVWLLTQSPLHRQLQLADLEWLIMPPLLNSQFYLFRDNDRPVGLITWALCSPIAAEKLNSGPTESANRLSLEEWTSGDACWLIDFVAPFADDENRQREIMFADLIAGPLRGIAVNFHQTDLTTGARTAQRVEANAGDMLVEEIQRAVE